MRTEPGTYAYEYDGPTCGWCGSQIPEGWCECPTAQAHRETELDRRQIAASLIRARRRMARIDRERLAS